MIPARLRAAIRIVTLLRRSALKEVLSGWKKLGLIHNGLRLIPGPVIVAMITVNAVSFTGISC